MQYLRHFPKFMINPIGYGGNAYMNNNNYAMSAPMTSASSSSSAAASPSPNYNTDWRDPFAKPSLFGRLKNYFKGVGMAIIGKKNAPLPQGTDYPNMIPTQGPAMDDMAADMGSDDMMGNMNNGGSSNNPMLMGGPQDPNSLSNIGDISSLLGGNNTNKSNMSPEEEIEKMMSEFGQSNGNNKTNSIQQAILSRQGNSISNSFDPFGSSFSGMGENSFY